MQKELVAVVDENDKLLKPKSRDELTKDDIVCVSVLWIEDDKGNVLMQQRSFEKKIGPGQWGPAVAGTVESHETYISNIVKEAVEEIGLSNIAPIEVGKKLFWEPEEKFGRMFTFFKTTSSRKAEEFTIKPDEVAQLKWIPKQDLLESVDAKTESYVPSAIFWRELFE